MSYQVEVTDTFGGEANYCWVRRDTIYVPPALPHQTAAMDAKRCRAYLVRKAKAIAGWTGIRCKTSDYGDTIEIRPYGLAQVCFVTWQDEV